MIGPVILSVIAFIAGHPTTVVCDATLGGHADASTGFTVIAWSAYGGDTIYAAPSLCDETRGRVGSLAFAHSIGTFIHEASHARGIHTETCAELTADIGVFDVLRRFYNVPFFTPLSRLVGAQVLTFTRARPTAYQPETCWGGVYH